MIKVHINPLLLLWKNHHWLKDLSRNQWREKSTASSADLLRYTKIPRDKQLDVLIKRNLIETIYPESPVYREKLANILKKPCTVYAGFDATSDSLHVGNLVAIMNLIHLRNFGHRVICVIGDATTHIGDPSGHTRDRITINNQEIEQNTSSIQESLEWIFKNYDDNFVNKSSDTKHGLQDPLIVRNSLWYKDRNVVEFVADIFRHVRVGDILHKTAISERLNSANGMNMSEFSYQIFQAYDWMMLQKLYNCQLQIGGSDQAGNVYTGHDLIKKYTGQQDSIGLLTPLITNSSGKKLGKSKNATKGIWLKPQKTTPYQLYQFFHQTPDNNVEKFLRIFSFYDDSVIENMIYDNLKNTESVWYCQKKLAEHVCKLIHGKAGLDSAKRITQAFFHRNPLEIASLSDEELYQLFDERSLIKMVHQDSLRVLDLLRRADCFNNEIEAEEMIRAGALKINGTVMTSFNNLITTDMIIGNGVTVMKLGKKNYFLFKWVQ